MPRLCLECKGNRAIYNFKGKPPDFCNCCKRKGMVDTNSNKCVKCLVKSALFNYKGEPARYCKDCKEEGMINVKSRKCLSCKGTRPFQISS